MSRLIVVDVSSFIFRAFFAIRPMSAPDGTPTNAVSGVLSMLIKLIDQYKPTHVIIARDTAGGSFRNEMYPEYKANRGAPPEELVPQFALIEELIRKMKLPNIAIENYEADDVIGSSVVQFEDDFDEILIASGDKDLMQFVNEKVKMLDTMKDKIYGPAEVVEKMGVRPDQIVDYLSLLGDTSDNIPGVKGIGAKGASKLLAEYETLENIFNNKDKITNKRVLNGLENHEDDAILSKRLIEIPTELDLDVEPDDLEFEFTPDEGLVNFLRGLGFNTQVKRIEKMMDDVQDPSSKGGKQEIDTLSIKSLKDWDNEKKTILADKSVGVYFNWILRNQYDEKVSTISVSSSQKVFVFEDSEAIHAFLSEFKNHFIIHDSKELYNYGLRFDLNYQFKVFDLCLAHFLIDPAPRHTLSFMAEEYLGVVIEEKKDVDPLQDGPERALVTNQLYIELNEKIIELELGSILENIDEPLTRILSKLESRGVLLDADFYGALEKDFSKQTEDIEAEIKKVAEADDVNLKSPKQVSELLFEKLELPVIKKTKTGYSTDSEVLNTLDAMHVSHIPGLILKFREIEKLNSTYVKTLPKMINQTTGRIHTTFQQTNAATGRLSSDHPNLQNIPVRTENGRLLRKGFLAPKGQYLFAADYSQVELRILAHFSEDPVMVRSFQNNVDIHAQTAAEVLYKAVEDVTKEERSSAKAVNFGLMYGQSSFGLSKQLGISRTEAKDYITRYFERFNKVKVYLDSLRELCEKTGYAETMFGRKRPLKDIHSQNRTIKAMAERIAINSPIQGTAADIIKLAMINIDRKLTEEKLDSRMILQVHDELIFEVPKDEIDVLKSIVVNEMENAVELKVPLKVDFGYGENWYDLK